MIFIIHGENYPKSRELISDIKEKVKAKNITDIALDATSATRLTDTLNSTDMFGNTPFVVFDISSVGRKNMDEYVTIAEKTPKDAILIIISSKELSAANVFIKNAVKLQAKVINNSALPSSNVFAFADNVFSFNRAGAYKELHKLMEAGEDNIGIFSMMTWELRSIASAKLNPNAKVQPKFYGMSKKFTDENIKYLYSEFYELDKNVKIGLIPNDMLVTVAIEKVLCLKSI